MSLWFTHVILGASLHFQPYVSAWVMAKQDWDTGDRRLRLNAWMLLDLGVLLLTIRWLLGSGVAALIDFARAEPMDAVFSSTCTILCAVSTWRTAWKLAELLGHASLFLRATLIATSRFSLSSLARYTSPIPPAPRGERIS